MKGFLFLLVLALSGSLAYVLMRGIPDRSGGESVVRLEEELDSSNAVREELEKEILDLKTRLRRYETVEETPPTKAQDLSGRLDQLRDIYNRNQLALNEERRKAELELADAKRILQLKMTNPPVFREQVEVRDDTGAVIGNRGTRTSTADRERATAKYEEEISLLQEKATEIEKRLGAIRDRSTLLDQQYRGAVERAKAESR